MRHILLTNDFPPKVGGIQAYLWELWRRLPPEDVTVYTASYPGAEKWDREQAFRVVRAPERVLLPHPLLAHRVRAEAKRWGAQAVVIDPALPLGLIGPSLGLPYAVVLHGAEVTVPGRLPVSRQLLARVVSGSFLVVSAGHYPEAEARRALGAGRLFPAVAQVPPGVDTQRFRPMAAARRAESRARLGLPPTGPMVVSLSRLVPRKGMGTLIDACSSLAGRVEGLSVAIAGDGRDRSRLERMAAAATVPVRLLGRIPEQDKADLYACADVFALCCRTRWWGLEQEGFGMVLLEAAAAGAPCVTVASGGSAEAVQDGVTGTVVAAVPPSWGRAGPVGGRATRAGGVAEAVASILSEPARAERMGQAGRARAERDFSYDVLAARLATALGSWG